MTIQLNINDSRISEAVEAYSSGPGSPIHTYVLRGGDRLELRGETWYLTPNGAAFWDKPRAVTVIRVNH